MKKIYKLFALAVLLCCGTSLWGAVTVLSEGFEGDLSNWTKQSCHSKSVVGTEAKHDGYYGFLFYYNSNPPQYLISKALAIPSSATEVNVSLYYKAYSSYGTEKFQVGYSTTDNDVANFTWDTEVSTNSTSWAKYTNSSAFPKETKYVAIKYNANDQYRLYIDDIEITCNVSGPALSVFDGETAISSGHNYNFGLATAGTTKTFTLSNPGTAATPLAVAHTGSFDAVLSAASIPAGGEVTLTVTMPEATGDDVITISSTAEGIDDFVINVSGTIRDVSKVWCNFADGLPEEWTNGGYTINTSGAGEGTSGGGYAGQTSYSYYRLYTPLLKIAEGEKLCLLVAGYSSTASSNSMQIQYSTDKTNWTTAKTVSNIANGSWTSVEVSEIPAGNYYIGFNGRYVYITDIYGGTLVARPKNLKEIATTSSSATLSWTAAGEETAWKLEYAKNDAFTESNVVDADSNPFELTGLDSYTTYYVRVRADEEGSAWSEPDDFRTKCGSEDTPWSENFETATANAVLGCWDNSGSTSTTASGSNSYYVWGVYSYSGNKSIRMYNSMVQGGTALINTPSIVLPASPAQELAFTYSHRASCGDFMVKISTDGGANFTDLKSYSRTAANSTYDPGTFEEATISLADYAGETIVLQFFATADYDGGAIFVDDIDIHAASSCAKPSAVTATATSYSTASVTWTNGGEETAWNIRYSTDGENWTTVAANANPFGLIGLSANTTYQVQVQANCGGDQSVWVAAAEPVATPCVPASIPFSENFESDLSDCWSVGSQWASSTNEKYNGSKSMRFTATAASDLKLPPIALPNEDVQLTFFHKNSTAKAAVYLNEVTAENKLADINTSDSWKQETIDLSAHKSENVTLIFHGILYSAYSSVSLYLDSVLVTYKPVAVPTNLVAAVGNASATITWNSEETGKWNLRYRPYNAEPEADWTNVANLEARTHTIEGLTNGTEYEVQVQTIVSANRQSAWTASVNFTPEACPTPSNIQYSNETYNTVTVTWTPGGNETSWNFRYKPGSHDWIEANGLTECTYDITTGLTAGEQFVVNVTAACGGAGVMDAHTLNYTSPSLSSATNVTDEGASFSWTHSRGDNLKFAYLCIKSGEEPNWADTTETADLNVTLHGLDVNTEYVFYLRATYADDGMSQYQSRSFTTAAIAPKNLTLSAVGTTTATLTWGNDGAATKYEWAVGDDHTALEWAEVNAAEKAFTDLTANTSYTFYVRSKYSVDAKSDSIKLTFRTNCVVIATTALPWEDGFEDYAVGSYNSAAPTCWAFIGVNEGTYPYVYVNNNSSWRKSGSKSLYIVASGSKDGYVILPELESKLNTLQVTFSHKEESDSKSTVLTLGYITNIANAETFVPIKEFTRSTSWQTESEISLASLPAELTARLAFKLGKATDNWFTGIDDIKIETLPTCMKPQNLQVESLRPDGAYITWQKGKDETQWQWFSIAANADTTGAAWDLVDGTIPEITLGGIENKTSLDVYVRSFCDPEVSEAVKTTFTVNCAAPTALVAEATGTTTASISWTAAADALIKDYQYVVVTKDATPDWNNAVLVENATSATISEGLTAGKTYDVYVRSFVYPVTYSDEITASFTTECAAITSLPWSENFEALATGAAPACWETFQANGDGQAEIKVKTSLAWFTFDGQALLFAGTSEQEYAYIKFPEITASLTGKQITFTLQAENSEKSGAADFGYTDGEGVFHVLKQYAPTTSKTTGAPCLLDEVEGRLTFRYKAAAADDSYAIVIDNIVIDEAPTCAVPTDLAASEVTTSSAKIAWTSDASAWKLQYKKGASEWTDVAGVITNPYLFEGLTENTKYAVRVAAVCGENNESEYCLAVNFTTECEPKAVSKETPWSENFDAETPNSVPSCWNEITANNEYAYIQVSAGSGIEETPALRLACQKTSNNSYDVIALLPELGEEISLLQIDFQYKNSNTNTNYGQLQVGYYSTGTFTAVQALERVDAFTAASVDFGDASIPEGARMAIKLAAGSQQTASTATIDNIVVSFHPTCYTPKNLVAVATADGASLTWTAGKVEEEWNIRYKAKADVEWKTVENNITSASYTLTGLTKDVEYEAQVRAYCSALDQSEWSASVTFTPLGETTGIGNAEAEKKAIKLIENNQLVIIHNGVRYNALGEKIQ